jgi:acyl-CoA reductase-like NAD-dependent aldehyde dehydrogenase
MNASTAIAGLVWPHRWLPPEEPAVVSAAIEKAHEQTARWHRESRPARERLVRALSRVLARDSEKLAALMANEIGKPVRFGRREVMRSAEMLDAIATRFARSSGTEAAGCAQLRRRPHGTIAVITPWNNPVYLAMGKIAPAVIHGNAVVWKPAPEALEVSHCLAECMAEAGFFEGVVSVLEGGRSESLELMNDPRIAAVTITGSGTAGASAQQICARRRIPLQAELGGNNAAIVWPDADLQEAARLVAAGAFELAGQRCTANRRVVVAEDCRERFLHLLVQESADLRWGDPLLEETAIGPMVNAVERDRVAGVIERAGARGVQMFWPQGRQAPATATGRRAWHPPVIVCCEEPGREIVQEETFGPVLVVQTARDWEHAIELCNSVRQGLSAAVFTGSKQIEARFLEEAEAGMLKVNQSTADASVDVPFGGWKDSSLGPPEHGAFDVEFYTRPQTVYGPFLAEGSEEHR